METSAAKVTEMQPPPEPQEARRARRSRQQSEEVVRYFLAKEGSSIEKPELGIEVASEGEALIKAFQSKKGSSTPFSPTKRRRRYKEVLRHWLRSPYANRDRRSARIQRETDLKHGSCPSFDTSSHER